MGKITKTASERHEATLSPFQARFIEQLYNAQTSELVRYLRTFPSLWPFPRGDLYHWIHVLNRFDDIIGDFIELYELDKGPQKMPFGIALTERENSVAAVNMHDLKVEFEDVELIKTILDFTISLLSNCGNRSLYACSDRLNDLLNTTDLDLLERTLKLSLLLAKRYYSSKQRLTSMGAGVHLSAHYNISLARVRKLAAPFATPAPTPRGSDTPVPSAKGKEKKSARSSRAFAAGGSEAKLNGSDFVSIVKEDWPESTWRRWADVQMTLPPDKKKPTDQPLAQAEEEPESPSLQRSTSRSANGERHVIPHRRRSLGEEGGTSNRSQSSIVELSGEFIWSHDIHEAVELLSSEQDIQNTSRFELLQKIRVAKAMVSGHKERLQIVGIRLLAIANLAYVEAEPSFYTEFAQPDSEQPRQTQVAYLLAELVQPPSDESRTHVPLELQTIALSTMDALTRQKYRANDVYSALNANVNHGILFYMVRKGVDQLRTDGPNKKAEEEWREALFGLLTSLPNVMPRAGDLMLAAGLLDILLEPLQLRTDAAERTQSKVLTFLDTFVYQSVREGYQTFANAKGLDIVKELTAHIVQTSFEDAQQGRGIPQEYKAPVIDYKVPFFKQLTLRWLCKFVNHLMSHTGANFGRQMRNLIDSPEMLTSLRQVMSHADVYGSNVWAGAVNIWTTFIHNEPTSYSVIAESKLGECFLDSLSGESGFSLLPVSEAISAIPQAFQALCLNEQGMKLVTESGSLGKFFQVFTSPQHAKAMDQDRELAQTLGNSFDELCRHQPTLRPEISKAVRIMVEEVGKSCRERARTDGFGAKLWVAGDEGKLYVAGGRQALGSSLQSQASVGSNDVDMVDEVSATPDQISSDEVISVRSKDSPFPTAYLSAATRFLLGYLNHSSMCSSFILEGGVEHALDLATSPCLPFSFDAINCGHLHDDLGRMLQLLADSKVHILLPSLVRRLQAALTALSPFYNHQDATSFFAAFTSESINKDQLRNLQLSNGTSYVKSMVVVNILCNALSYIFSSSTPFAHRPSTSALSQVNLTDAWVDVVEKLGKLQRSCTWEDILLTASLPEKWVNKHGQMPQVLTEDVTDRIMRFTENPTDTSVLDDILAQSSMVSGRMEEEIKRDEPIPTARFENTRVLRHLFHQVPHEISQFFNSIGKVLLPRRSDATQKYNSIQIADQLAKTTIEALKFRSMETAGATTRNVHHYWICTLLRLGRLLIEESFERTDPQTLTLILKSFKEQGGFDLLEQTLNDFFNQGKSLSAIPSPSHDQMRELQGATAGIKTVLLLYSRFINSKLIQDAAQTISIAARSAETHDFSVSQFIVEMRYAVIKPALRLWDELESSFISTPVVRNLIDILRIELEAEGETKALTRKDKVPRVRKPDPRKWAPKNGSDYERLASDYSPASAEEALYRCFDHLAAALEYAKYAKEHGQRSSLLPVSGAFVSDLSPSRRRDDVTDAANDGSNVTISEQDEAQENGMEMVLDVPIGNGEGDGDEAPRIPPLQPETLRTMMIGNGTSGDERNSSEDALLRVLLTTVDPSLRDATTLSSGAAATSAAEDGRPLAGKVEGQVTVDDLNDVRQTLRQNLIDRCLSILHKHTDLTFELAELILSSISKGSKAVESRKEVAEMLLPALTSLEIDNDDPEEEARITSRRIASYSHLIALLLNKSDFYELLEKDLVESFSFLVGFIKPPGGKLKGSTMPAVANVLLITERLLSSDAVPQEAPYIPLDQDGKFPEQPPIVLKEPLLTFRDKQLLFDAVVPILMHVGRDESLALSILRILVMLTRTRSIALQLGEKQNMRRLFLMARQMQDMTDEKIQSSFLIILRHIIEDDETLLNIMKNEIMAGWSSRSNNRSFDTTHYLRQFSQMALRNPQIFIQATNQTVMISKLDRQQGPQVLKLKEDRFKAKEQVTVPETGKIAAGEAAKPDEKVKSDETSGEKPSIDKATLERSKTSDLKMPVVENPDGVVHFILSELLNYKDVEDTAAAKPEPEKKASAVPEPASTEVNLAEATARAYAMPPPPPVVNGHPRDENKPLFRVEDHAVYVYRCFLLQCLTELLSCYNRAKIEFINFKRKPDAPGTTPSKPRSQVLNYLMHDLIPTGTLGHADDITSKKRDKTSAWAMYAVVALCSKTGEGGYAKPSVSFADYVEEPELLFVRKFVLEHAIKLYRDAMTNESESAEARYSRLLGLADLFNRMLTGRPISTMSTSHIDLDTLVVSQRMLAKTMYEKGFISAMTSSVAEIDLTYPNAKRAVKYILKPLKILTTTAIDLSLQSEHPIAPGAADEEEISTDSETSSFDGDREQTPDLYRNSALGILEPNREEEDDSDVDEDDEDDEEQMYDYGDDMDFDEEMPHDHDDVVSDEEQELADMGSIEGLPGDVGVDMEIVGMEVEDDDDDDDEDSDEDEDDDGEELDDEMEDMEDDVIAYDEDDEGIGADDQDWESQPDDEEDAYGGQIDIEGGFRAPPHGMPEAIDAIVRELGAEGDEDIMDRLDQELNRGMGPDGHDFIIDGGDMDQDENEDDEEEFDEEEIAYEPELDDDDDDEVDVRPWGWDEDRASGHRHHHQHHGHTHHRGPWGLFREFRDRTFPPGYSRSHRNNDASRRIDDGTNPLLQRPGDPRHGNPAVTQIGSGGIPVIGLQHPPPGMGRFTVPENGHGVSFLNNLIQAMSQGTLLPGSIHHRGGALHVTINNPGGPLPGELEQVFHDASRRPLPMMRSGHGYMVEPPSRPPRDDPSTAIAYVPALTQQRWAEESRILFGMGAQSKADRILNDILRLLVPPAVEEAARKRREEEEAKKKREEELDKARKEKEELERKEKEEREAKEKKQKEEREAEAAAAAAQAAEAGQAEAVEDQMEGIESTAQAIEPMAAETAVTTQRVTTIIDGREIDITNLGIDPDYLEALPEDMRQEVIMEQTLANRQTQADTGGEQPELDPEFLQALPPEMREELVQQLHLDQRRREREAARRLNAPPAGQPAHAEEMDAASFFATLDPGLRNQLLMEVDEEAMNALPPNLQAEARQLNGGNVHRRLEHYVDINNVRRRELAQEPRASDESVAKRKPTTFVQILDKPGVATLLRLMFVQQSGSIRNSLNGILRDVCQNKQNRAEVVSILLSILQDGSNDLGAVEKSFSLLSLRAKTQNALKTPQPKRSSSSMDFGHGIGEMSPITVVQQCLVCLETLVHHSPRIAEFFLTEHETATGFKPRSTRKGKGKETKASKYPINALLGLLDRKIIIESAPVMELLASLLQHITHPLLVLLRKEKEKKAEDHRKNVETSDTENAPSAADSAPTEAPVSADVVMTSPGQPPVPAADTPVVVTEAAGSAENKEGNKPTQSNDDKARKRTLTPPEVPEYNLRLIINIIAARECPSKTFKDTLSLITNLSTIPEAKEIFGQELISQAQALGVSILDDLSELDSQIAKAQNGADVQGMALAKFSPASSDQAKLLRVITALDFLFDPKRAEIRDKPATPDIQSLGLQQKEDILTTLYENSTFVTLWDKLSKTLSEIHQRDNMFSVANILLPLIEVLMVVCKNTTLKDAPIKPTQQEISIASPEPESRQTRMENLFFNFTEKHRKILNELVRHNPKLMSGSFALLVKNSKVLEFDNKRNFFNRRLHIRTTETRQPHPTLQLSIRRDAVFLDSFKHLYYKKPEEFKYGKLNIRFAGEEGVDAGGVTREWFQALTKQMFDPNYALFVPVAADRTTFHPNSESSINEQHLTFFKFIGRIIGKALYEGRVLDCHFSRAVYKRILGRHITIKDMESLDNDYAKNLQWMLENEISGIIQETFSVTSEVFGEEKTIDLIPNGRNIEVTDENKHEYVQRVVEFKLIGSVKEQLENFLQGFHDIVPAELIAIFNEQELELLISGLPDIDVDDWRNNTEYHNYQASSPQIQWFWRAVRSFDKEERAKLLQFVTGTSKVPLNGFKELEGMNGFSRFNIHRDYGSKDRLPSSHTCFNQLDLPEYDTYEELRKSLYTAITAGSGYFGFA